MKKIFQFFLLLLVTIILCSCSTNIIPKGYSNREDYTNQNIENLNSTLQYSIYTYNKTPDLSKNKFLEKMDDMTKIKLELYLYDFEEEILKYDFKDKYTIKINEISNEDYVYIDYKEDTKTKYFMIYYLDISINKLYYCYLMK